MPKNPHQIALLGNVFGQCPLMRSKHCTETLLNNPIIWELYTKVTKVYSKKICLRARLKDFHEYQNNRSQIRSSPTPKMPKTPPLSNETQVVLGAKSRTAERISW